MVSGQLSASFLVCPKGLCRSTKIRVYTVVERDMSFINGIKIHQNPKWKVVGTRTVCSKCGHEITKGRTLK